ncbi:velvet factor-domain-containing protein [Clohesyomyces aquaticus]|uniref:Velvet factor-domain-containing protein n=1 Tax=Clohesyomyces aquaticus TaxID=1231657 RepID=A0A1Y1ZJZ8_9PLEO|nr:velvet factor-domain-containing protein [Clohesyomyces aquaticus]
MVSSNHIPVANEINSQSSRITKEGRRISYALQVIQQPERARACGSGAKSSADRRPVDPPPIVELRVYEGEGPNKQEITFAYNANFFLFATLENARVIAPGRTQTTPTFPVLTGTPVAGMAYLDRPTPAGYFIFPDLSVRHEGNYRLSFALYEELKEQKDMDPDDASGLPINPQGGIDAHVSHRLEVKSTPFLVYSAKKFPGLSESTALSRMVAEQGCRVRIRRDVRMRRRENKSSKEWDEYEEEAAYDRARRTATPDNYAQQQPGLPTPNPVLDGSDRPRSVSNASNTSFAPPRRPSMEDLAGNYQASSNFQSMAPPQTSGYSQIPQYGTTQNQYQSQFAPPPQPAAPLMQPPQAPYSHQPQQTHNSYPSPSGMHMGQSYGYMPNQGYQQQQQSHYEQPAPIRQEPPVEYAPPATEYRRPSMPQTTQQYPGPSQMMPSYNSSPMDQYNRPTHMNQQVQPLQSPNHSQPPVSMPSVSQMPSVHSLAPLKTLQPPAPMDKIEPVSPLYQSPPNSIHSGSMSAASEPPQNHGYLDNRPPLTKYAPMPQPAAGHKRPFSSTFDTKHMTDRMQQGARPNPGAYYDSTYDDPDMEEPMDRAAMSYRRADGTHRQRHVPPELGV